MDLAKRLQQALEECERLRAENEHLKRVIETQLPSYQVKEPAKIVTSQSTVHEKVALFRNLFRGRTDVFAVRWESQNGKSGYAPACLNEWKPTVCKKPNIKCVDCTQRSFVPLSDQVIYDHLSGKDTVGLYPLLPDHSSWFLAIDFDENNWQIDVQSFVAICKKASIPYSIERSRSGNGAHVWIFFSEAIPASLARTLGQSLIRQAQSNCKLDSYDRLFPSQDTLSKGGLGNLIALPLQRHARANNNSVFVNNSFQPYKDQWEYLSTIEKMSSHSVKRAVNILSNTIQQEREIAIPDRLSATRKNGIYLDFNDLPASLLNELVNLSSFGNPQFYKAKARRQSTHNLPPRIDCSSRTETHFILPRGCEQEFRKLMDSHKVNIVWKDERYEGHAIDVEFHGSLSPQQSEALQTLLQHDAGVLSATTGFGKTVTSAALIAERKVNTLVIVHRKQLIDQWIDQLSIFLNIPRDQIGRIGGGSRMATGNIDIATIQSLNSKGQINPAVTQYGQIIIDECHHLSAFSFEQVLKTIRAKYIYGLTATPVRKDGLHPIITLQCGPILYKTDAKTQAQIRPFRHCLVRRTTSYKSEDKSIQAMYNELAVDPNRNQLIFDDVLLALEDGRTPLLLTERVSHVNELAQLFKGFVKNIIILTGEMKKKERDQSFDRLMQLSDDEELLIIATGKYIGEGFDFSRLDALFLTMPISWKGMLTQYVGRLHRNHSLKEEVRVYDYVDQHVPTLQKMFEKRLKSYRALGYVDEEDADWGSEQMRLF